MVTNINLSLWCCAQAEQETGKKLEELKLQEEEFKKKEAELAKKERVRPY